MAEITFEDIKKHLSERGALEVELAAQRALVAWLKKELAEVQAGRS